MMPTASPSPLIGHLRSCQGRFAAALARPDFLALRGLLLRPAVGGAVIPNEGHLANLLGHRHFHAERHFDIQLGGWLEAFYPGAEAPLSGPPFPGLEATKVVGAEAQRLVDEMPRHIKERLGLVPTGGDWWLTVFHLAVHFPMPFLRARRMRVLRENGSPPCQMDESYAATFGAAEQRDVIEGNIHVELEHDLDASSGAALGVLMDALAEDAASPVLAAPRSHRWTEAERNELSALRDLFASGAGSGFPVPIRCLALRLADSFTAPPAIAWAPLKAAVQPERFYILAQRDDIYETVHLFGPAAECYFRHAERGGALLTREHDAEVFRGYATNPNGSWIMPPLLFPQKPVERWLRFVLTELASANSPSIRFAHRPESTPKLLAYAEIEDLAKATVEALDLAFHANQSGGSVDAGDARAGPQSFRPERLATAMAKGEPYSVMATVLHELYWLASEARRKKASYLDEINHLTTPWDAAEQLARKESLNRGIPFAVFDPVLIQARDSMLELSQVAFGNESVAFDSLDTDHPELERRLKALGATFLHATPLAPTNAADARRTPFSFKREGEYWRIQYGEETGAFKPIDGMTYIAHLLRNPGRAFPADAMRRLTAEAGALDQDKVLKVDAEEILSGQVGTTKETPLPAFDRKTEKECKKFLAGLPAQREAARLAGDTDKLILLEVREQKVKKYLANGKNVHGGARLLADSQRSTFNTVKQAIDRALDKLLNSAPALPHLHEHLTKSRLMQDGAFEYRPPPPMPAWEL